MKTRLAASVMGASMLLTLAGAPAQAGDDRERIKRTRCSETSSSKLKVKTDDGRLEVEFEVDQNRSGDKWKVRLRNDGNTFFRGKRTTGGASGSFSVERKTSNGPGKDRISGRARNRRTDEVCRTSINF
jgi:catechol 2,3-dioxygenase-like lactoylglutathione lyase family enzyme